VRLAARGRRDTEIGGGAIPEEARAAVRRQAARVWIISLLTALAATAALALVAG
jgi:hypothetical protein